MLKSIFIPIMSLWLISLGVRPVQAQEGAIVELFTSQGCSSCPPAEQLLTTQQAALENVYFMAMHVDYWDYLGWNDPFAKRVFTQRQQQYAQTYADRSLFTPQFRVNGGTGFSDHTGGILLREVKHAAQNHSGTTLQLNNLRIEHNLLKASIHAKLAEQNHLQPLVLYAALTEDGLTTRVKAGENRGRTLRSDGVVRWFKPLIEFRQMPRLNRTVGIPLASNWNRSKLRLVVFLQNADTLHIITATGQPLDK